VASSIYQSKAIPFSVWMNYFTIKLSSVLALLHILIKCATWCFELPSRQITRILEVGSYEECRVHQSSWCKAWCRGAFCVNLPQAAGWLHFQSTLWFVRWSLSLKTHDVEFTVFFSVDLLVISFTLDECPLLLLIVWAFCEGLGWLPL